MKNKLIGVLFLSISIIANTFAFEAGQLSLDSVSNFEEGEGAFSIRHRFYGDITDLDTFFGLDDGSNTMLSLRYSLYKNLALELHHSSLGSEYNIRAGYLYKFAYLHTQININYFSFKEVSVKERQKNFFTNVVLQTPVLLEHLTLTTNLAYDNFYEKAGVGLGVELSTQNFMPIALTFTESLSLIAEYYSKYKGLKNYDKKYNSYTAGIKFRTFGHHFEVMATNSIGTEPRIMIQGSNSSSVHFAFNINRKF